MANPFRVFGWGAGGGQVFFFLLLFYFFRFKPHHTIDFVVCFGLSVPYRRSALALRWTRIAFFFFFFNDLKCRISNLHTVSHLIKNLWHQLHLKFFKNGVWGHVSYLITNVWRCILDFLNGYNRTMETNGQNDSLYGNAKHVKIMIIDICYCHI